MQGEAKEKDVDGWAPLEGSIGIIGSGALGGFYGIRLALAGHDVRFLMRRDYDHVKREGLTLRDETGDRRIHPPVARTPEELGPCAVLLIGLKATDNAALAELLGPCVTPETTVLTLQNGMGNEEAVLCALEAARPGHAWRQQIVGGTSFLCSNRVAPGVVHHIDQGWVRLAEFEGPPRERTHRLAALFRSAACDAQVYDSLKRVRWEKLVWNIPFNGLGVAAIRADTAAVLSDPNLLATVRGLMAEVLAAARSEGIELDAGLPEKMIARTLTMGPYRSSMQIDFEESRPLEVEAILGEPLRRAQAGGVHVPLMEILYAIVRRAAEARTED